MMERPETVGPYRLYYWYAGVDPKRPGGAWWRRDFVTLGGMLAFLNVVKLHLHAYAQDNKPELPIFEAPDAPPAHAEIVYPRRQLEARKVAA